LNPKEHSKSSFILLNDGKNYEAYIMTLLADSAYAKNHPNWALGNTYQKRDPAFSGLVLYFTPKGGYVSGYAFRNGQQVIQGTQNTTTSTTATRQNQLTRSFRPRTQAETIYDCTAWWLMEYDQAGNLTSITFLYYTDCIPESGGGTDSGTSGSPSSAAPPPAPQCQPPSGAGSAVTNNHILTRVTQPPSGGGDGGMPPPQTCPPQTVVVNDSAIANIINNLTNPCLSSIVNILVNGGLNTEVTNTLTNTFGTSDKINLTFSDGTLTGQDATAKAQTGGTRSVTNGVPTGYNLSITFNDPQLKGASQEYLTFITIHEIYHAYLDAQGTITGSLAQHMDMAQNYVNAQVALLIDLYPALSANNNHDALCLVLSGYGEIQTSDPTAYASILSTYGVSNNDVSTTSKSYQNGTGTPCSN